MSVPVVEQTIRELEERFGSLYDLAALAKYCQVGRAQLRHVLERGGVPTIEVGPRQLVPRELAERALGLDLAEVLVEIHRNEQWMRQQEFAPDGRRKAVREYAEEMDGMARDALNRTVDPDER